MASELRARKVAPLDLEPGRHFCFKCMRVTDWGHAWRARGKQQQCNGCGDRFPCRNKKCRHLDCELFRGEAAPRAAQ